MNNVPEKIGLALSGGGIRAMAFHCGVLRWLAQSNRLEMVTDVSSVSGGSLFMGLVFAKNGGKWPTSSEYLESVHPQIRNSLTSVDLQSEAFKRLFCPRNWRFLLSRANVLSESIEFFWGVNARLSELPKSPTWSINGTTAETGKRFRFKQDECGDYELGYADASNFSVANAMAVSAAFPIGIGPFVIRSSDMVWRKRKSWKAPPTEIELIKLPYPRLHLYDGGVYDNLGLEPLFDIGTRELKSSANYILVSDAGMPFVREPLAGPLNPFRLKRLLDISLDQTRSLRIRAFANQLQNTQNLGIYLQIGSDPKSRIETYRSKNEKAALELLSLDWLDATEIENIAKYPTTLHRFDSVDFDRVERHGFETACWNEKLFQ